MILGDVSWQVDAVVEVPAPEHIVMRLQSLALGHAPEWNQDRQRGRSECTLAHVRELYSAADVDKVLVPFLHLGLVCSQV